MNATETKVIKRGPLNSTRSYVPKKGQVQREWWIIDIKDKTLGRVATRIAKVLQGKHKPTYTPFLLTGDYIVVVNAKYVKVTGNKWKEKIYNKYTGYHSGRKEMAFRDLIKKNPARIIYLAVKGMLPKTRLAKQMIDALKIYPEQEHPHVAQNPKELKI